MVKTIAFKKGCFNKGIVIYGAGVYGEIAVKVLTEWGETIEAVMDRNHAGETIFGIKIISPDKINENKDKAFIIASLNYFKEIYELLNNNGVLFIYNMNEILLSECNCQFTEYALEEKKRPGKYIAVAENALNDKLLINHIEIVLTEKCTLRCKDCGNYIQYYEHPEDMDVNSLLKTFDRLVYAVDGILELRLLGGEPFIYKDIDKVLQHYLYEDKIKSITIYTNGTLIPDEKAIEVMSNNKVTIHISNYGEISNRVNQIINVFEENNVAYYVHDYKKWRDFGDNERREYDVTQLKSLYESCVAGKCYTFYRGKLYKCPRSAHGERLGFFRNGKNDQIDVSAIHTVDRLRYEVNLFLMDSNPPTACLYCNGESNTSKEITAAIQMPKG